MKYVFSIMTMLIIIYELLNEQALTVQSIALFLLLSIIIILRERFFGQYWMLFILCGLLFFISRIEPSFNIAFGLIVYYFFYDRHYVLGALLGIAILATMKQPDMSLYYVWTIMGGIMAYTIERNRSKEHQYLISLDEERRLRFELEALKNKLLKNQDEIEYLTEIKERNRIARQIHDSVGHNIAGVLFQLQAAYKIAGKDFEKSQKMIELSTKKLSETLELTRETVYNIQAEYVIGISQIKKMMDEFDFCPIDFQYKGNFNSISTREFSLMNNLIKESLTNATKYSRATALKINLELNDYYFRYSYLDNGVGCNKINTGMGLRSMREQIENLNGTFVIDGQNGFHITANVPRN